MRSTILVVTAASLLSSEALAQARRAQPSGRATTQVTLVDAREDPPDRLAPVRITVDYGQPHLRGRTLHTADLVPYNQPWRTGANAATQLSTDVDLVLGGASLSKGTYYIMTLPSPTGWKLMLYRDDPLQSRDAAEVARIDLRRRELTSPVESLTITLIPANEPASPKGELRISWGNVELATDWSTP